MGFRDQKGRFKSQRKIAKSVPTQVVIDHNYSETSVCNGDECKNEYYTSNDHKNIGNSVSRSGWKQGQRFIELNVLLDNLKYCQACRLGPVPLTCYNHIGELQKGLGGYLYVVCQNVYCGYVNRVAYGKTNHEKDKGMACFVVNTKLGTAMVDSLGGPVKVNNLLSTLNLKPIGNKNLKAMEERAGEVVMAHSAESAHQAAVDAFKKEMEDISVQESSEAHNDMVGIMNDLGVCPLPDESPSLRLKLQRESAIENDSDWTDVDKDDELDESTNTSNCSLQQAGDSSIPANSSTFSTPKARRLPYKTARNPQRRSAKKSFTTASGRVRYSLAPKYPCRKRIGMSCAVDTAWHKHGFDSLTSHTFFMIKAKYGKKVVKTVVIHRKCGTCNWWRRNRPGQTVRQHKCVRNHQGNARLMESVSGVKGIQELVQEGTPAEYIEGDGDNTMLARLKNELNVTLKKRDDRNHVIKNVGKSLYALHHEKGVKLSKSVIIHIEKCLKYALANNQGDRDALEDNLKALIPYQFGDHSLCNGQFCGYKRKRGESYVRRSLPYKTSLKDAILRDRIQQIFDPLIAKVDQYVDLGSSKQCEHANREVTLRASKHLHYGGSKSLDYSVHATAAFINDGRNYISKVISDLFGSLL